VAHNFKRNIVYYKRYYLDFFNTLAAPVQLKFNYTLGIIAAMERVPAKFLKYIEEGIYEVRVEVGSNIFRVFCFFDDGQLVVLINGFQKKTQKTPNNEILAAKKIKKEYFDEKSSKQ
jgi:phage-related protein